MVLFVNLLNITFYEIENRLKMCVVWEFKLSLIKIDRYEVNIIIELYLFCRKVCIDK